MLVLQVLSYHLKHEALQNRITLAQKISVILRQLNANFFEEKGIHFYAGPHATWIEMLIQRPKIARKAMGSFDILQDDLKRKNSYQPSPFNKFSVPVHQFAIDEKEEFVGERFLFP